MLHNIGLNEATNTGLHEATTTGLHEAKKAKSSPSKKAPVRGKGAKQVPVKKTVVPAVQVTETETEETQDSDSVHSLPTVMKPQELSYIPGSESETEEEDVSVTNYLNIEYRVKEGMPRFGRGDMTQEEEKRFLEEFQKHTILLDP